MSLDVSNLKRQAGKSHYIGPYRKWAQIKRMLIDYLKHGGDYIHDYRIKGASAQFYHSPNIKVTLLLMNRRGKRLREIRQEYLQSGQKPKEFLNEIMVMMTTESPPKGKKAQ